MNKKLKEEDKKVEQRKHRIGFRLHEIRQVKHMSMQEVADHSTISKAQVSRLEHGVYLPRLTTLYSLAKAYGLERNHFLRLLGLEPRTKTAIYKNVPVILSKSGDPELDINCATHYIPFMSSNCPKHCFFVRVWDDKDGIKPLIHRGSLVLIDQDFNYTSGKVYAVSFGGHILIGRIFKSIHTRKDDPDHRTGVLIVNNRSFFSTDYPRGEWKVLGRATRYIDDI